MPVVALAVYAAWLAVTVGLRVWHQRRHTGDTGVRLGDVRRGSAEWWAALLFFLAVPANPAAPLAALAGLAPLRALDRTAVHVAGVVIAVAGLALTSAAQLSMGEAWRIGVDHAEHVRLVTGGPFRLVRNPIYCAMAVTGAGMALISPNPVAVAQLAALAAGLHIQVRGVEEPYLRRIHGAAYAQYASRVGRFIPGIGRSRPETRAATHMPANDQSG
jgi:protein-S-isoprenylcysteine O-methyltransferase Ste14